MVRLGGLCDRRGKGFEIGIPARTKPRRWLVGLLDFLGGNSLGTIVLHNQLGNRDYAHEMDFAPKDVRDQDSKRRYSDFISGNWAWRQAVSAKYTPE
jgi:hypothetical protein